MANSNELSDFAETLRQALLSGGYKYIGKIDLSKINVEEYKNLSSLEMVNRYSRQFRLAEHNKMLEILKGIYANNQKGIYSYSLNETLDNKGFKDPIYKFAVKRCGLIHSEGENRHTTYQWLPNDPPIYGNAEHLLAFVDSTKATPLSQKAKQYIEENCRLSTEELNKVLNPENSAQLEYKIGQQAIYSRAKIAQREKKKKVEIPDKEIARTSIDQNPGTTSKPEDNKETPFGSENIKRDIVQIFEARLDYISTSSEKQIKILRKLVKEQNKYITQLEKQLLGSK